MLEFIFHKVCTYYIIVHNITGKQRPITVYIITAYITVYNIHNVRKPSLRDLPSQAQTLRTLLLRVCPTSSSATAAAAARILFDEDGDVFPACHEFGCEFSGVVAMVVDEVTDLDDAVSVACYLHRLV